MKTLKGHLFVTIVFVGILAFQAYALKLTVAKTKWKNNAKSAYSIMHDDFCESMTNGLVKYAYQEADKYGFHLAYGAIVSSCEGNSQHWAVMKDIITRGHEIVSHTYTHPAGGILNLTGEKLNHEILDSKKKLEEMVPGLKVTFFCFPEDLSNTNILNELKKIGYLGARAGDRGVIKSVANFDPLGGKTLFDAYHEKESGISVYGSCPACLKQHLDAGISSGGWAIRELHGIADQSWGVCALNNYQTHLKDVKTAVDNGNVWMGAPTEVCQYILTYNNCGNPTVNDLKVTFPDASKVPQGSNGLISLRCTFDSDPPDAVKATQGGRALEITKVSTKEYFVQADPTKGEIEFSFGTGIVPKIVSSPNPLYLMSAGDFSVFIPKGNYSIALYSASGRAVTPVKTGASSGSYVPLAIRALHLSSGFYIISVNHSGGVFTKEIFVNNQR
ncbi:MAG: polysaccharide deacetylase family protein [Chitinivibrionales bacterium]|nr:polysaccharide deacetylase family protein [Chitinivibrionales bacterium]